MPPLRGTIMKNTTCDPGEIWKQFEDLLVPQLGMSIIDRAAYSHLLRHSRLEGRVRLRFSIVWLARGIGLSSNTARDAVRRLVNHGALRLVARNKGGHVVEVRIPEEIRGVRARRMGAGEPGGLNGDKPRASLEETDFMRTRELRKAIHARERGLCFYCLRRLTPAMHGLDHVVPRARSGCSSYRNLVSCCLDCNSRKGETLAGDFLRLLFREGRLTAAELTGRLRALEDLASGKLLPALESNSCSGRSSDRCFSSCGRRAEFIPNRSGARLLPPAICREQASSGAAASPASASVSPTALAEMERMTILRVFEQARGDKALAGKMLGISRATLYRKLKRYNMPMKGAADDVAAEPQAPSQLPG
jgi:hypothetical protein